MYEAGGWVLVESALADLPGDLRWLYESGAVTHRAARRDPPRARRPRPRPTSRAAVARAADPRAPRPRRRSRGRDRARRCRRCARAIPRVPLGRAVDHRRHRARTAARRAGRARGRSRSDRCAADRTRSATSRSSPPPRSRPTPSPICSRVPEFVARAAPRRAAALSADRSRADRRPPAGAGECRRDAALPHRVAGALRGAAGARRRDAACACTADGLHGARRHAAAGGRLRKRSTARSACRSSRRKSATAPKRSHRAAAANCRALVTRGDIRGDLHMHSLWSDGRDSIEAMVQACVALGYEYMAITDHSQQLGGGAQPDRRRREEAGRRDRRAARAATRRSRSCTAARSTSCRTAGSTFPIAILERFDIVLASLHERPASRPDQLLKRYAAAMQHPLVTLITHPTNRLVPHRRGYDLDYDRLFELAVETGPRSRSTARRRTSISTARSRAARSPPARPSSIDSDCHRAEMLGRQMHLGHHHRAARLGRAASRAQHAARSTRSAPSSPRSAACADPRRRRGAPPTDCPSSCRRRSSRSPRSRSIARRCCRASTSATPDRSRRWSARRSITPRDGYPLYFAIGQLVPLG